jgi:alkylated DNA repair dioxygenase AlkB
MQQIGLSLDQNIETLTLPPGEDEECVGSIVQLHTEFIDYGKSIELFDNLKKVVQWEQESLWIAGKERQVPRLVAWYGEPEAKYRYSGRLHQPMSWIEPLDSLRKSLENELKTTFNSVLCNLYRNGQDSMGWHADDEKELGAEPVIASVSLGASRYFHLKHKTESKMRHKILLTSGSLLIMKGTTQQFWLHQVPKEPKVTQPRINLTFRQIIG